MRTSSVFLRAERSMPAALAALPGSLLDDIRGDVVILPASLQADDPVAEALADRLRTTAQPSIITPVTGAAARRAFFLPAVGRTWRDVPITRPGAAVDSVQVPASLVTAAHRLIAVDVVEVARHGPFVLDVIARYVHPRQRLRLVADRQRSSLVAEVASAALPSLAVVSLSLPGGALVAATDDPIAAELVALALAERCLGPSREFTGPWEDAVVQRATELELGVLLPAGITLHMGGNAMDEPWAVDLIGHLRHRLGIPAR